MTQQINYLKTHPEISDVLAQGFAHIYHQKPQFPITFLAHYLKNHEHLKKQKKQLVQKLSSNQNLALEIKKEQQKEAKRIQGEKQKIKIQKERQQGFEFRIKQCANHQQILNQYCQWIEKEKKLTGVYIGQLENQWKKLNFDNEDGQEAHIDNEAPKIIKFKAASNSHNSLMIGKTLTLDSVIGRILTEKNEEQAGNQEQQGKQKPKPKGECYIPLVQQNKQLTFFKYPKLGAFYAVVMRVRSYLHQKIFDANIVKTQTFKKVKQESDKQTEDRQAKFRVLYDEKAASGADQKQLQELEKNFQKEEESIPKPKLQEYEYVLRQFVVCFDTLGLDTQINDQDRTYLKNAVQMLRSYWQNKERELLQKDIDSQLKLVLDNLQNPQQQALNKLVDQQDKELPTHEEVQKVKANQKLAELQIITLRIQKIKQYVMEEKYISFFDILLDRRVLKFPEIMKFFYLYAGFTKEEINYKGTNIFNWLKAKTLLTKQQFLQRITTFTSRGSKPDAKVKPYAKWQRVLKNIQKYDLNSVASFNIFLAFILRFLFISGKVRIADNEARKNAAKAQRQARQEKIKEAEQKSNEKKEKMQNARAQAQGKEQNFDEQAWLKTYEQENPAIQIGDEVFEEADHDLQQQKGQAPPLA